MTKVGETGDEGVVTDTGVSVKTLGIFPDSVVPTRTRDCSSSYSVPSVRSSPGPTRCPCRVGEPPNQGCPWNALSDTYFRVWIVPRV